MGNSDDAGVVLRVGSTFGAGYHNRLVLTFGAYQNGTWVVAAAKGGCEEGVDLLAESQIVGPSGEVVAQCLTDGDEVIVAACDLEACGAYKYTLFDFDRHRRPEVYSLITELLPRST